MAVAAHPWFDEIDLDPSTPWLRMGTRQLGDRPWLVSDDRRAVELALKDELLAERWADVVGHVGAGWRAAAEDVRTLIAGHGAEPDSAEDDPLVAAARVIQEDLCLLRRRDGMWHLDAACLCFPSRWRLADKLGRPMAEVHGPVDGYAAHLERRVTGLLDSLGDAPVLRRNWFVHPDGSLFQPEAPAVEPVVEADGVLASLHVRSERQTLRRLPSGWVLFTIRIQHAPLGEVLVTGDRLDRFRRHLEQAKAADLAHRGMSAAQVVELRAALG